MAQSAFDVAIAGGGVIGLSIGWQLAKAGRSVVVVDQGSVEGSASWASGGMLGAQAEVGFEELDLYKLGVESMHQWPAFTERLEEDSGISIEYSAEGTLLVADDRDGAVRLKRAFDFQKENGIPVQWISPGEARSIEPLLTPRISAAVLSRGDHQVDPRRLVRALQEALRRAGGVIRENEVIRRVELDRVHPAWKTESGDVIEAETAILATGAWSGNIVGLPEGPAPVRPVKGQMIELRMPDDYRLGHVLRATGSYLAPKRSGRLLVGSTSEEMGFDTEVTGGGLYELLERAWRLVPGIYEMGVTDSWAGLRPATPDHVPLIGFSEDRRLLYATGHYRQGIMLTPVTAATIRDCVLTGETPGILAVCNPSRFKKESVDHE